MNKAVLAGVASGIGLIAAVSASQVSAPLAYKDQSGRFVPLTMVSGVNSSGTLNAPTYKSSDGQWHPTVGVSVICGVDSNGFPQICPSGITQAQADMSYMARNNPTFSGTMNGLNNANINADGGTIHAGYLVADATVSATAYNTGWGGWYSLNSPHGSVSMNIKIDDLANLVLIPSGAAGGVLIGAATYATLPTSEPADGVSLICSDCVYNGVQGVQVRWSSKYNGWVTMDNTQLTSKNIVSSFLNDINVGGSVVADKSLRVLSPNSAITGGITSVGDLGLELINSNNAIMDLIAGSIYSNYLIVYHQFTFSTLPTGSPDGAEAICSDCTYNGVTGVKVRWSSKYSGWFTEDGVQVLSAAISVPWVPNNITGSTTVNYNPSNSSHPGLIVNNSAIAPNSLDNQYGITCGNCTITAGRKFVGPEADIGMLAMAANYTLYGYQVDLGNALRGTMSNGSIGVTTTTWAKLSSKSTDGALWICTDCTLTYNGNTTGNPMLRWNSTIGASGGWDYDGRILGVVLNHP